MLEFKLTRASFLKNLFEVLKELCEQGTFACSPTSLRCQSMDRNHIAFVDMHLSSDLFPSFRCGGAMEFTIPFERLVLALKCSEQNDSCFLRCNNAWDYMDLLIYNGSNGKKQEFELKPANDNRDAPYNVPRLPVDAKCSMRAVDFQKTCRNHATFSKTIEIEISSNAITFKSVSQNDGTYVSSFTREDVVSLTTRDGPTKNNYSLQYLTPMCKGSLLAENNNISMTKDWPIMLK